MAIGGPANYARVDDVRRSRGGTQLTDASGDRCV